METAGLYSSAVFCITGYYKLLMSLFSKIFSKKSNNPFLGIWYSDLNDQNTKSKIGNVKMIFTEDGKLTYEIIENNQKQIINMIYVVDGSSLITNQPSHPKQEKTNFEFINKEKLILEFNNDRSQFVKNR